MKTITMIRNIFLAVALAVAMLASACGGEGAAVEEWTRAPQPTTWLCIIDVSQSTLDARRTYLAALERALGAITYGDRVVVMSAENSSVVNADLWVEQQLPSFSFTPSTPRPDTDNDLLLRAWADEQNQRYRAGLAAFGKTHDLARIHTRILARVRPHVLRDVAAGTDLFGALYVAGTLMHGTDANRVVLITDGLVQSSGVNWRCGKVAASSVDRLAKAQRKAGELPDLCRADVILVGASTEARDFAALRAAWCRYVEATGGKLESQYFMSKCSSTLFDAWVGSAGGGS